MELILLARVLKQTASRFVVIVTTVPADASVAHGTRDLIREMADSEADAESQRGLLIADVHGAAAKRGDTIVQVRRVEV